MSLIRTALNASSQAYCKSPRVEEVLSSGGSWSQIHNTTTDQACTIFNGKYDIDNKNIHIVAFRGTDGSKDWLYNLSIVKTQVDVPPNFDASDVNKGWFSFERPRIHRGFYNAWLSIKRDVEMYFQEQHAKGTLKGSTVMLVGHSLGSALSMCAAWDLYGMQKQYDCTIKIVGIGGPRLMDIYAKRVMDQMYGDNGIRINNGFDIVTMGCRVNGYFCFREINIFSKTYWDCFVNCDWLPSISKHRIGSYLQRISFIGNKVLNKF